MLEADIMMSSGRDQNGWQQCRTAPNQLEAKVFVHQPAPPVLRAVSSSTMDFMWQLCLLAGPAGAQPALHVAHQLEYQQVRVLFQAELQLSGLCR